MGKGKTKHPPRRGKPRRRPSRQTPDSGHSEPRSTDPISNGPTAAATAVSSIGSPSSAGKVIGEEPNRVCPTADAPRQTVDTTAYAIAETEQADDELIPGIEYDIMLTAPPKESISCLAIITSISNGRTDLPISDSVWERMMIDDGED